MDFHTDIWAGITSNEGMAWTAGFGMAAMIRIFCAGLAWAKKIAGGRDVDYGD